jgi:hypothetical protein
MSRLMTLQHHRWPSAAGGGTLTANVLDSDGTHTVGMVPSIYSASITVTVGRPVIVIWSDAGYNTPNLPRELSGAGQTWVKILDNVMTGDSSNLDRYAIWISYATVGGSGSLTFTNSNGTDNSAYAIVELEPEAGKSVSIGAPIEATQLVDATTNSVSLGAAADYWFAVSCSNKAISGTGLSATPRAGWTELSDDVGATGEPWHGAVETQLSPHGGDSAASVIWSKTTNIALIAFPLTVS